MKSCIKLSLALIILSLWAQTAFSQTFTTIASAKTFLSDNAKQSWLLTKLELLGNYYILSFEGRTNAVRISKNIVYTAGVDPDDWKAYFTYTDHTKQEIPYLGINGISNVEVTKNPFGICPLVATLNFDLKAPGKVKLTIVGRDAQSFNLTHTFPEINSHWTKVPVLGLYEGFLNTVVLSILSPDDAVRFEQSVTIQTDAFPDVGKINISKNEYNDQKTHLFLILRHIYDQQGYLRWIKHDTSRTSTQELYPISGQKFLHRLDDANDKVARMFTFLGETVQDYTVANGAHHEYIEKTPGGNLLFGSATVGGIDDGVTEIDRVTGNVVRFWDMADYVDKNRQVNWYVRNQDHVTANGGCWFHLNTVRYDPNDNTLVVSSRHQNAIVKIGYDDGKTKWILGNHKNWTDQYKGYLLTPLNFNTSLHEDQDWTYLQHTPHPLPNGNILVFDNGGSRPGFTNDPTEDLSNILDLDFLPMLYNQYDGTPYGYVRAVEYKVDPVARTVEKVFEYTDFPTIPTTIIGSVDYIDEEHIMIGYGELRTMAVFNKNTRKTIFMAHSEQFQFYRSFPIEFYPTVTIGKGAILTGTHSLCLIITIILSIFAF